MEAPMAFEVQKPLFPFVEDHHLPYLVPAALYWILGFAFYQIEKHELLLKYKLHSPAETLKKNRASRRDVIQYALLQQAAQISLGYLFTDDSAVFCDDHLAVEAWTVKLRELRSFVGHVFHALPLAEISLRELPVNTPGVSSQWEQYSAIILHHAISPFLQFVFAMILADTFQYFSHRAFHVNKWLYRNIHYMHHEVYVPFAYGAFYNHPLETIPIDCIGLPLCLHICGLSNRQSALFGAIWTFKTVIDHCGYTFDWNPCNIICSKSVQFHDLHHQPWGMKYNFSVYTSFWDKVCGTFWDGNDRKATEKYQKGREVAEAAVIKDDKTLIRSSGSSTGIQLGSNSI